jgi:hypothetical protein
MGGPDTVVTYKDLNRAQPLLGVCYRVRTAFRRAQICHQIFEPHFLQLVLGSGDAHHIGAA